MMPYKHTKFQVKSRQGAGLVSKRNTNREKSRENSGTIAKNRKETVIARKSFPSEATEAQGRKKPIKLLQNHKINNQLGPITKSWLELGLGSGLPDWFYNTLLGLKDEKIF